MMRTGFLLGLLPVMVGLHGSVALHAAESEQPKLLKAKPVSTDGVKDELQKLQIQRYNAALEAMQIRMVEYQAGRATIEVVLDVAARAGKARLELLDNLADRLDCLEELVEAYKYVEAITRERFNAGRATSASLAEAKYARIDAEVQLLKAKKGKK